MTKIIRHKTIYMEQLDPWIYIVERSHPNGRKLENRWSRMPAVVDPAKPPAENVDKPITAREVPKKIRVTAREHFEAMDRSEAA